MAHCILASGDLARGGRCSADTDRVCFSGAITFWIVGESHNEPELTGVEPAAELGGVSQLPSATAEEAGAGGTIRVQGGSRGLQEASVDYVPLPNMSQAPEQLYQ